MSDFGEADAPATPADVVACYELALGRQPDSPAVVSDFVGCAIPFLLGIFFEGPEFAQRVKGPIAEARHPQGGFFEDPPEPALLDWVARRLRPEGDWRSAVEATPTWPVLYYSLFSNAGFLASSGLEGRGVFQPAEWEAVRQMAANPQRYARRAAFDEVSAARVAGWALNPLTPDVSLTVELWIDGVFAAATPVSQFRRDLQDRFGGSGVFGFSFTLPPTSPGEERVRLLELRDPAYDGVLAAAQALPMVAATDGYDHVRRELAAVRAVLDRLEAGMPQIDDRAGFALEDYAAYFETYYAGRDARNGLASEDEADGRVVVLLDAAGAAAAEIEDVVWALIDQSSPAWRLAIHGLAPEAEPLMRDLQTRVRWREGRDLPALKPGLLFRHATAALKAVRDDDIVLVATAQDLPAPGLVGALRTAFVDPAVDAVYFDEDRLGEGEDDVRHRDHIDPVLKPAFDPDLLAQTPYVGSAMAFRGGGLRKIGLAADAGALAAADALLRMSRQEAWSRVVHLARILGTRRVALTAEKWRDRVDAAFKQEVGVLVEDHADPLGAAIPDAVRVRRVVEAATATVIVPTRDALDLLRPCIESLLKARHANRVAMDLCVIDHQSQDPATLAYLAERQAAGDLRVMPFDGAFNWAAMNNMAADQSRADVLVFLNNDTVVLSPDWLDVLSGEALRPGVGAVGARLLYDDGTLQHAGFVARGRPGNFLVHEGVGRPGSDAGYMGRHALLHEAVAVTGACMAVSRQTFRKLGGFDATRLPVDANDVDYCLRAQAGGYRVLYSPYATLYHLESKSRGFSRQGAKRAAAEAADRLIWARWGAAFGDHGAYNPHFDREARPFTRLRPPR